MASNVLVALAFSAAVIFAVLYLIARFDIERAARRRYEQWRASDLQRVVEEQRQVARREAQAELEQWRNRNESAIRQDAIERSRSVIVGKVTEHVTPWIPAFPYNPKDARFIGSPIDMIVFDGCDEDDVRRIIFLEIKTNASALTARQRQIRDAILARRVEWRELRVQPGAPLPAPGKRRLLS